MQLHEHQERINQLGAAVLAITFEPPEQVARFTSVEALPYPVLSDPELRVYAAFGLQRGSMRQIWSWRTIRFYIQAMLRGRWPRWPHGDIEQLGGDFVFDPEGRVVFAHRSAEPADRPTVDQVLSALQTAVGAQTWRRAE